MEMEIGLKCKTGTQSMLCKQAIVVVTYKNEKLEDYCNGWLILGLYNATYDYFIHPTQGQ
ncbi:hypothetical protein CR513_16450, partial [Mucuna pruriens]